MRQTERTSSVGEYGRSRPRARSVDTGSRRNSESECTSSMDNDEEDDHTTPLLLRGKHFPRYNRSHSLDSDRQYQLILYETSRSWLTSGLSVSLSPSKQNSIVTMYLVMGFKLQVPWLVAMMRPDPLLPVKGFAIWNTIIGSSLLAVPWSIQKAGLGLGLILILLIASLAVYTAYRLLDVQYLHGKADSGEVPYLCRILLGHHMEFLARIFSFTVTFGANVVYWILMSNCLYHSVGFLVDTIFDIEINKLYMNDTSVLCPPKDLTTEIGVADEESTLYQKIWNLEVTVPIFLVFIVGPLLNFQSPTFFTKFNSLGSLSVIYLLIFILIKGVSWGMNVDFHNTNSAHFVRFYEPTFFAQFGMLPLSLFIHNIVITLMRNNRNQEHNNRDLSIAYVLVVLTYLFVGFIFYVCFPLAKACIQDNMLNNFPEWDGMAALARLFLFFQLLTVYPLLTYMLRTQIFSALNYPSYPSFWHVLLLNTVNVIGCILFAIFLPRIGTIIRFTGAMCGFVYVFTLPCLLYLYSRRKQGTLTFPTILIHTLIPFVGFINLVAQFFVTD